MKHLTKAEIDSISKNLTSLNDRVTSIQTIDILKNGKLTGYMIMGKAGRDHVGLVSSFNKPFYFRKEEDCKSISKIMKKILKASKA